eukprot:MONOS_12434.1-p1 / transcript=MONOS_12434.1 / gene=MONOS_12434 / organism=Monocercomonoides_exilis_PA203 / gene_product=unspecified product / transcript_product=unspecified product / location=Mono_scaffold00689:8838-9597(-) / protein_length=191 / sequence_SO=supercontig / SO=protein_coding / is_pseudo=false
MIIRGITKETVVNLNEKEDEFFVLSEPDYSSHIELVGGCHVIAGKFPEENMLVSDVKEIYDLSDLPTPIFTNYKSRILIDVTNPTTCPLEVNCLRDKKYLQTQNIPAGFTGVIAFNTSHGENLITATSSTNACSLPSTTVRIENGTMDMETVDEIDCPDNICTFYGFYFIQKTDDASECYAISHQFVVFI